MNDARLAIITLGGVLGGIAALVVGAALDSGAVQVLGLLALTAAIVVNAFWRHGTAYGRLFGTAALLIGIAAVVVTVLR